MLDNIKAALADGITAQAIIDVFAIILDAIFGFIKDSEGWVEAAE